MAPYLLCFVKFSNYFMSAGQLNVIKFISLYNYIMVESGEITVPFNEKYCKTMQTKWHLTFRTFIFE